MFTKILLFEERFDQLRSIFKIRDSMNCRSTQEQQISHLANHSQSGCLIITACQNPKFETNETSCHSR